MPSSPAQPFTTRPLDVEAAPVTSESPAQLNAIAAWIGEEHAKIKHFPTTVANKTKTAVLAVRTAHGYENALPGSWVVRRPNDPTTGRPVFEVVADADFEATYQPAED